MKYKITVVEVTGVPVDDRGYSRDREDKIYEQIVDTIDLQEVIKAVNGMNPTEKQLEQL